MRLVATIAAWKTAQGFKAAYVGNATKDTVVVGPLPTFDGAVERAKDLPVKDHVFYGVQTIARADEQFVGRIYSWGSDRNVRLACRVAEADATYGWQAARTIDRAAVEADLEQAIKRAAVVDVDVREAARALNRCVPGSA